MSSFVVVPLFALANAGVVLDGRAFERLVESNVSAGVALGLVVGKPLGIFGATALALRSRRAALPNGTTLAHVAGVGLIAGIGFTVSLFIADLSFEGAHLDEAKVAILVASLIAGALGAGALTLVRRERHAP